MSNFVGKPQFSNSLWVAIETMHFYIAHTKIFLRTPSFRIQRPNKQFGTHEKLSWGLQGNLNWMQGYGDVLKILKFTSHSSFVQIHF